MHRIFIVLNLFFFYFSNNSYSQWQNVSLGNSLGNAHCITFVNDEIGFCSGNITYKTIDGGNNWFQVSNYSMRHIDFFNSNVGFAAGRPAQQAFLRTTDGGDTWDSWEAIPSSSGPTPLFNAVIALSENEALFAGHGGWIYQIFFEEDGTITLSSAINPMDSVLTDMVKTNMTTQHILSGFGKIKKSIDNGSSWTTNRPENTSESTEDMLFINENIGFVIGRSGTVPTHGFILKTSNAGNSYSEIFTLDDIALIGGDFYDENHGFVVGTNGTILYTEDGGINWELQDSGTTATLKAVKMTSPTNAVIIGNGGVLLRNFGSLSINENQSNFNLKIYPNPSNNFIYLSGNTSVDNYKIYNLLGSEILSGKIKNNKKINIKNLTNGLYLLVLENGITLKFLKE